MRSPIPAIFIMLEVSFMKGFEVYFCSASDKDEAPRF